MPDETAPQAPNRNISAELDMSQPDGIPREREPQAKGPDGRFVKADAESISHPAYLTELASSYGFDAADCAAMSSESLGRAITRAQKRDTEWQQRLQSATPQTPQVKKEPEPEPELDLGLDPADYDEKILGAFNKLKTRDSERDKELKAMRRELADTKAREDARSQAQAAQMTDDAFEALGPEYEAYFGKGSVYEVREKDPAAFRRRVLCLQETGLNTGVASGKQLLAKLKAKADEIFKIEKAAKPKEEDPYEAPAKRNGRPTRAEWDRGGTAIPTDRTGAEEPKGYERAVRNAERRAKEAGHAVAPSTAKEDAELLATFKRK